MSKNYLSLIITHGNLASCLRDITEKLVVKTNKTLIYSNQQYALEEIEKQIQNTIETEKPDKTIIFTDLAGGSCWLTANRIKKNNPNIIVVGGVNIPMLVSFNINAGQMSWDELLDKMIVDAQKGIILR